MKPYARESRLGQTYWISHAKGFTKPLTKRALAAKKPIRHGARQEKRQLVWLWLDEMADQK